MAYAVISDIHANLHALNAVLRDIEKRNVDEIFFTGDIVGYGPRPDVCIDIIKKNCKILIAGNHDWAVIGYTDIEYFNEHAAQAVVWTQNVISNEHIKDLENFSLIKSSKENNAFFVHSTPKEPEKWSYIYSLDVAEVNFRFFKQQLCFVGHSHRPVILEKNAAGEIKINEGHATINSDSRYIINSGSVGQPRDGNSRSAYSIVRDDFIEIVRVEYDIKKTQQEMAQVGLPDRLIERLSYGM